MKICENYKGMWAPMPYSRHVLGLKCDKTSCKDYNTCLMNNDKEYLKYLSELKN